MPGSPIHTWHSSPQIDPGRIRDLLHHEKCLADDSLCAQGGEPFAEQSHELFEAFGLKRGGKSKGFVYDRWRQKALQENSSVNVTEAPIYVTEAPI